MATNVTYPHPLEEEPSGALTFLDQALRRFSTAIRKKPNWRKKIMDRKIMAKWIQEAAVQDSQQLGYSDPMVIVWDARTIEFADKELKDYKNYIEELQASGSCIEPDIDAVWRADGLIDEELRQQLIDAVAVLENVPEEKKDWHPGTNNMVLDLVHPSLWPVIYGRSVDTDGKIIQCPFRALEPGNNIYSYSGDAYGEYSDYNSDDSEESYRGYNVNDYSRVVEASRADRYMNGWSKKFCWLPSEFEVSADGTSTKISSYINNLNGPGQKELFYPILEKIFSKFVPMFNHLLADLNGNNHHRFRSGSPTEVTDYDGQDSKKKVLTKKYYDAWEQLILEYENDQELTVDFEDLTLENIDSDDESENNEHEIWDLGGVCLHRTWSPPNITDDVKLNGKTAKVIVKLANIILTPENPVYDGGSWHVEAMRNERIIATGIYYYSQENITDSELRFRRTVHVNRNPHVQWSNWGNVHDMNTEFGVQELGQIETIDNRAIVFPNVYQHCVSPFRLEDQTKPGHRKILVFFLCDPSANHEIPTTKTVTPQQPGIRADLEAALRSGRPGRLAEEIFQMILKNIPPPIPLEEAEKYRAALMRERSNFTGKSSMVQGIQYNFCEH
ncbi:hypothetical protein TWF569_003729 [Orbilia oligospora]|uniref:Uncharacterized protein n=2 Tax=Orbilia oligospora TaxID=2813651 RepID=A0A7C8N9D7_ORBOL|nr:hypothetical protein TWF706_011258 [Orbilia oligospora]KAF3092148.1 hypothetical protein TWF102_008556 [Orbilia oligospora]KAF3118239.1 hypothetical protein TWF103_000257 [Orbilia oligospora]KAF3151597.1 hypothetical protein TWF569_003729 [Orbilia oligospora]